LTDSESGNHGLDSSNLVANQYHVDDVGFTSDHSDQSDDYD